MLEDGKLDLGWIVLGISLAGIFALVSRVAWIEFAANLKLRHARQSRPISFWVSSLWDLLWAVATSAGAVLAAVLVVIFSVGLVLKWIGLLH